MDSRLGRRWNRDPVSVPWESEYAVNRDNPISYNDPNGDCPNCVTAAIGAGVGALIGGGFEIASQLYSKGSVTNWRAVGGSALQGGIVGGAAGFTGGASLLTTAAVGGVANGVGGAINNKIQGKKVTALSVTTDVALGAVFAGGGKLIGNKLGQVFKKTASTAIPTAEEVFTNNISSRVLAEDLAQTTKYKGFQNANDVLKQNNPIFDLFDKVGNVVDITTTDAKTLTASQFTKKLTRLGSLGDNVKTRTLQIYVKMNQYSNEELKTLTKKLETFITDKGLEGKVKVAIDKIK